METVGKQMFLGLASPYGNTTACLAERHTIKPLMLYRVTWQWREIVEQLQKDQ